MTIGMMWLTLHQTDLATEIKKAVEYYHKKYGVRPDKAFVNPSALEPVSIEGLMVSTDKYILPKQIWIGVEE